jgi:hypothetical protein
LRFRSPEAGYGRAPKTVERGAVVAADLTAPLQLPDVLSNLAPAYEVKDRTVEEKRPVAALQPLTRDCHGLFPNLRCNALLRRPGLHKGDVRSDAQRPIVVDPTLAFEP